MASPTQYAVFGWVRRAEAELRLAQIPTTLSTLISSYYDHGEHFSHCGRVIKSSKCKRMIRRCKLRKTKKEWYGYTQINDNLIQQKEAYGYTQISSMNNKSYQWDFDCEIGDTKQLHPKIGIISSDGKRFGVNIQTVYARFKIQKKTKTRISMVLNLSRMVLNFTLYPCRDVMYRTIKLRQGQDIKYRLWVFIPGSKHTFGKSIEILNFFEKE